MIENSEDFFIIRSNIGNGKKSCRQTRLGVRFTATEWIAVALLGQERSPQPPWQEAQFRLRPAAHCRRQNKKKQQTNEAAYNAFRNDWRR